MAIGGTQLYNKDKQTINPISEANAIDCTASGKQSTVHQDIADLYKQISDLTGDDEAVSNIIIEVRYKRSKSKARKDVEDPDGWGMEFINPTSTRTAGIFVLRSTTRFGLAFTPRFTNPTASNC